MTKLPSTQRPEGDTGPALTKGMQLFFDQLQAVEWLKPWELVPPKTGELYAEVLAEEMAPGHVLEGRRFVGVARRGDCDDVLFLVDEPGPYLAVIHLTWAEHRESNPKFPWTVLYTSVADFVACAMQPDHAEREDRAFPGIVCTPGTLGGAPRFEGHRLDVMHAMFQLLQEPSPEEYFASFGIEDLTVDDLKVAARYCRSRQCQKDRPKSYCSWCTLSLDAANDDPEIADKGNYSDGWKLAEQVIKKFGWG